MIKPSSYWALHKTCDAYTLGRVGATLGGQKVSPPLNPAEAALVAVVRQDSEWMDERIDSKRERWKERQRKARASRNVTVTSGDNEVSRPVTQCHDPSIPPSIPPPNGNTIRSVPVQARARARTVDGGASETERNGNGTDSMRMEAMPGGLSEAARRARRFAEAAKADAGAFFDAQFDPVTVCAAVTGDFGSLKRWRQLVAAKGEGAIREEAFAFWREISSGEDVGNRGAALNARLSRLPDEGGTAR